MTYFLYTTLPWRLFTTISESFNLQTTVHEESHNGYPVCKNYNLDSLLKFDKFPYLYWTSTTRPKPSALNNTFSFWPLIAS